MDSTSIANKLFLDKSFKLGKVSQETVSVIGKVRGSDIVPPSDTKEFFSTEEKWYQNGGNEFGFLSMDEKTIFTFKRTSNFFSELLFGEKYLCEVITGDHSLAKQYREIVKKAARKPGYYRLQLQNSFQNFDDLSNQPL